MARPTTKVSLLEASEGQFTKLWALIDTMPEQTAAFQFEDRDKNLRDVLIHLHEWHKMLFRWYQVGVVEGGIPAVPGEGYTWRTTPALNLEIWKRYQSVPLEEAKTLLRESHAGMMKLIEGHTNEELFDRGVYKWTKTSTLGAYFIGSTSSHYEWAMKKIKRHLKTLRES